MYLNIPLHSFLIERDKRRDMRNRTRRFITPPPPPPQQQQQQQQPNILSYPVPVKSSQQIHTLFLYDKLYYYLNIYL